MQWYGEGEGGDHHEGQQELTQHLHGGDEQCVLAKASIRQIASTTVTN